MKLGQKGSFGGAIFLFVMCFIGYIFNEAAVAFIWRTADVAERDWTMIIGSFVGLFTLFIIANYMVSSITDGEGGIRDIFKFVAYALTPITLVFFIATPISHLLTQSETFILTFARGLAFGMVGIYLFLGLQETHGYGFARTIQSILITILFVVIAVVVIFNMIVLSQQIFDFIEALFREVYVNVAGLY